MNRYLIGAALVLLSACGTVVNETRQTAELQRGFYKGERYEIVTQTIQTESGTFDRTQVYYRGISAVCRINSPRDCELAAQRLIDERLRSSFL